MKRIKNALLSLITLTLIFTHHFIIPQQHNNEQLEFNNTAEELAQTINDLDEEERLQLKNMLNEENSENFAQEEIEETTENTDNSFKNFNYKSASVLPIYTTRKSKYLILSREAYGRPKIGKKWTYDDFGGSRDAGEEDPLITAAREFFEEAILDKSLNLSLDQVTDYVKNNTHVVVANTTKRHAKHVTYIIDFKQYKNEFIRNFYTARKNSTQYENLEKDRIAIVRWNTIEQAFSQQCNNDPIYVQATIIDPKTRKGYKKQIKLRPYFIIKLKSFFLDKPHKTSKDKKIRFYA